ncbi:4Fe-4S dicluster domain-containing protein [Candidatus Bipolaricaulota bacterium]
MEFRLQVAQEKCSGCRACQVACSEAHGQAFNPAQSRMFVTKDDVAGIDAPVVCRYCTNAACVSVCPAGALTQTEHGWLALDTEACVSCARCMPACPFDALRADPSSQQPLACDGCGGSPACVGVCVTGALGVVS